MSAAVLTQCLLETTLVANSNNIKSHFLYPKLVILGDSKKVLIVDIQSNIEKETAHSSVLTLEDNIADDVLQDQFLWLILKSHELIVINISCGSLLKIRSNNYASYKIMQFVNDGTNLFMMSESGECLQMPFTLLELRDKAWHGESETVTSIEKSNMRRSRIKCRQNIDYVNGINAFIELDTVSLQCCKTGLLDTISINTEIEYIVPWTNSFVLANKCYMWIIDVKTFDTTYAFPNVGSKYYPLNGKNNTFYYLLWDTEKVQVYSATLLQADDLEAKNSNIVSAAKSSQDTLKNQLNSLIEAALSNVKPAQVLPQLQALFNNILDYNLLISSAIKLCNQNILYKVIVYPLQAKVFNTNDENLINLVNDLTIKIDLLEYILFRGNNLYEGINLFEQNFIQLCILFISKSDLDLASICWLKYSELKLPVESQNILNILNAIPHNIKLGALIIWLQNFAPSILEENPFFIDLFVKWTTERVFNLEQSSYWPKIGLKLLQEVIIVLENSIKTISIRPASLDDLDVLKDHINYIMELKEKYRINMLLSELSSQNPTEVAIIMLRRCYTEDLESFLQNNLPSYAACHLFEVDNMLNLFIESEAALSGGSIDGTRLQMLLKAFRSTSSRLDCLLQVLKVLDVPWDTTILDLAMTAAASVHKDFTVTDTDKILAQEIHKELNYARLKVILKKYNFPLNYNEYILVLHKIVDAPSIDLDDLKVITNALPTYTNISNILYIDKCLQNCETKHALNYFKELKNKEQKVLIKTAINKYELIVLRGHSSIALQRNYLDFFKGTQSVDEIQIMSLESMYHLKNSYAITMSVNDMYREISRESEIDAWLRNGGAIASSVRGGCISHMVNQHLPRNTALLALLRQTSTCQKVREAIECIITSNPCDPKMISVLSTFKDGSNSEILLECSDILSALISNCQEEYIHYLMLRMSILNSLINTNIILKNLSAVWKFHYIFLQISSVNTLNDLINFYDKIATNEIDLDDEISAISNRSDFIPFRLLSYSMSVLLEEKSDQCGDLLKIRDKLAKKLLIKIIASQDVDNLLVTLLLIVLIHFEDQDDKSWILDTLRGQTESFTPSMIQYISSPVMRQLFEMQNILPGSLFTYPPQYILKSKFNIDLCEIALPDNTEETWDVKVLLFHVLRQFPSTPLDRLYDLCRTLNINFNDGLSLLLVSILTSWELKYSIVEDELGCRKLKLENDENDLITKCTTIWDSIDSKDFLQDMLQDFWKNGEVVFHGSVVSINPYYYEVFMCIYNLVFRPSSELRSMKEYFLLIFLKDYSRKSAPKQYEFETFSVKGMFPEIGYNRLPFHLFMRDDMWSHLKSEITLETYERWLPVVAILSLDNDLQTARDMICSNAVKQTMTSRSRNENTDVNAKENEPWKLTSHEEPLLRAAHKCVRHIANMEWAGACLFYVLQGCARGADQVAAAQLCYQFSQRWAALQPGNRAVRQMERLHATLSTRHVLHKIDWVCEEFIRLSTEPAQLIHAMYLHPNFVEKISRYDINRATNEIADKNSINISSIRIQILENMLEKIHKENISILGLNTKELIIAKYILKATCPKMGAIYLSRIAFDDESDFNKSKKLRAFQCLLSVVDADTAVKVTNSERETLWPSLLELFYVVNLEKIDVPWVVATFMQDKLLAIQQLAQVAGGNIEGLRIAAKLAHRYGNQQIIHDLIPLMLRASLYDEIIPLLLKSFRPLDDIICTAWRAVMLTPFQRADYPITEKQRRKCLDVLNLLPVCPLIKDEDLIEIWRNCIRCKCLGLGCLILPYMTLQTRQKLSELQKIDRRNLVISLKNLQAESYLVSGAMIVLETLGSKVQR